LGDMFRGGFEDLGITDSMISEMMGYWSNSLNADDMFESISRFIHNVIGIQKEFANLQQSGADLMGGVRADMGMSFADQLAEYDDGIMDLADTIRNAFDFEDMNIQGEKLLGALQERYQMEIQYLQRLAQMQDQLNKSADEQLRGLQRLGMTNEQQLGLDMTEYQSLMAQLAAATTAEESAAIFQQIQALISEIVGLAGDDAVGMKDQLIAMLEAARAAMNEKVTAFADAVAAQNEALYAQIGDVLGYFTGEAYDSGEAVNGMTTAVIAATNALWGLAGGDPNGPTNFPHYIDPGFRDVGGYDTIGGPIVAPGPGGTAGPGMLPGVTNPTPSILVTVNVEPDPCGLMEYHARAKAAFLSSEPEKAGARFNG